MTLRLGYAIVASGGTISNAVDLANAGPNLSVWCPPGLASSLSLLGSFDATAANFKAVRMPGSPASLFIAAIGSGNVLVPVVAVVAAQVKVQISAAPADARSFVVLSR